MSLFTLSSEGNVMDNGEDIRAPGRHKSNTHQKVTGRWSFGDQPWLGFCISPLVV